MVTPPRDSQGRVVPHDDRETIPDDSYILRSIPSGPSGPLKPNKDGPGRYLSSGAFSPSSKDRDFYQSMSGDSGALVEKAGMTYEERMQPGHEALVKIRAGDLRALGYLVGPDPKENNPTNPFHAGVWGVKSGHGKRIKRKATWVVRPGDVSEDLRG